MTKISTLTTDGATRSMAAAWTPRFLEEAGGDWSKAFALALMQATTVRGDLVDGIGVTDANGNTAQVQELKDGTVVVTFYDSLGVAR